MIRTLSSLVLIIATLQLTVLPSLGGKLYKWVDEKGVIHFSDRLPEKAEDLKGVLEERNIPQFQPPQAAPPHEMTAPARSPIEHAVRCTFTIRTPYSIGTGFLLSADGYAATCKHVIEGRASPVAVLNDQREFPIQVITVSHRYDLALIQVLMPDRGPHLLLREAESMVPGERLFAIGASAGLQATVTDGVFTGFRKIAQTAERLLQFSAPVNQGNSGGPLLDEKGKVVGVVTLKYLMRDGHPVSGVGFAVPSASLREEFGYLLPAAAQ